MLYQKSIVESLFCLLPCTCVIFLFISAHFICLMDCYALHSPPAIVISAQCNIYCTIQETFIPILMYPYSVKHQPSILRTLSWSVPIHSIPLFSKIPVPHNQYQLLISFYPLYLHIRPPYVFLCIVICATNSYISIMACRITALC